MIKGQKNRIAASKYLADAWYGKTSLDELTDEQFRLVQTTVAAARSLEELKKFTQISEVWKK
jgi:hypothetical protein